MLSKIQGTITRRLLVNFIADPNVVAKILPAPFRPQLYKGKAVVGICLIHFEHLRPMGIPRFLGLSSENAAHRFAVEWDSPQGVQKGVYISRRHSNSYLKTILSGRVFSGVLHHAQFQTVHQNPKYSVQFTSRDKSTKVVVDGEVSAEWPKSSLFENLQASSQFFENGSVGYSPSRSGSSTGMKLFVDKWVVENFKVNAVESSFFSDRNLFPKDSIQYDHTLIMRNIEHSWSLVPELSSS